MIGAPRISRTVLKPSHSAAVSYELSLARHPQVEGRDVEPFRKRHRHSRKVRAAARPLGGRRAGAGGGAVRDGIKTKYRCRPARGGRGDVSCGCKTDLSIIQRDRRQAASVGPGLHRSDMINGLTRAFGLFGEKFIAMLEAEPTKPTPTKKPKREKLPE